MSKREDDGQTTSEPTALIVYKAPATAPVPTFFATEPPMIDMTMIDMAANDRPPIDPDLPTTAKDAPAMPRAATLGEPPTLQPNPTASAAPSEEPGEPERARAAPAAATSASPRSGRFTLLAASVALAASLGAVGGSLGYAEYQRAFGATAAAPRADAREDIRALKETVAQLRANVKTLNDNLAAVRASATASSSTVTGQLTKIAEALDRVERGDRRAAVTAPATEVTGSVAGPNVGDPKPAAKPPIVEGWVVRKIYDGAALIEGRYGMVEVEPGMNLPGLGRVQEIKRQDGHWVVVTPKGLIMQPH